MDEERTLIGMWLQGLHLKDIDKLNTKDFALKSIVDAIKDGKDAYKIAKETGIKLTDLMEMTTHTSEVFYQMAYKHLLRERIFSEIKDMKDLEQIDELIQEFNESSEAVEADCNLAMEYANEIEERTKREYAKWVKLPYMQYITNGIKRKELTSISARPGVGKSAFALQQALGVAEQGKKVLYFPLEMSRVQTWDRALAHKGIAKHKELLSGKIDQSSLGLALDYIDNLEKKKLFKIYENVSSLEVINAIIKKEKPYLVVIDQLTQMTANQPFKSVRERFTHMTKTLKSIAMKENVAIFLLCQLNRNAQDGVPTLADLKESGSIEEDSDNCILLHNLKPDDLEDPTVINWQSQRPMTINLAKQRSGEPGSTLAIFEPNKFMFYERERN